MVKRRSFETQYSIRFSRQDNVNASFSFYYIFFFGFVRFDLCPYDGNENGEPCDNIQIDGNRRTDFHRLECVLVVQSPSLGTTTLYIFGSISLMWFNSKVRRLCQLAYLVVSTFVERTHRHTIHWPSVICCHFHCNFWCVDDYWLCCHLQTESEQKRTLIQTHRMEQESEIKGKEKKNMFARSHSIAYI